ncbi:TBC1 domain family member 25-like isoform X1 [Conger conger]|uniref:TBC1 domain family member 25-like isoform X1 n=1 Tax=Conger conger TaxID=82655 RepID=UPI002A5A8A7E|nr:TBC1 domain family member 25-like isoform X1 [Conger conger]
MAAEEERGVVRVRVKKSEGMLPTEFRSFAVDPQITSLEVLQHILVRAFELNGKRTFGISYLSRDRGGVEVYLSLLSDWDLDAAFVSAAKPYLQLKIDIKPCEDSPVLEDWDIISPKDVISSDLLPGEKRSLAAAALPFTQSLLSQVGRTLSRVQQALSWTYGEEVKPFKPPLSDTEFHSYLNGQGQLSRPEELRLRIYHGGVEPSLRKVVWRYLLNVYPDGLTGQERMDYMKRKTREYDRLKAEWMARASTEDLEFIRGNVLKDVLRTDRAHPYYAGSEDSPHLSALTDLLTTYAITHPQVSYCQGMSDIASPILAVMDNEAHAFICFCGIMKRLEGNFRPDGQLMSVKFQHLKLLLRYSDPEFYAYLVSRGADDLFFCYRWILLELKREFAFEDALRMLEVTWSSLPPDPPETEVELLGPAQEVELDGAGAGPGAGLGEQKARQRRRHMLRPSREEGDWGRGAGVGQEEAGAAQDQPREEGEGGRKADDSGRGGGGGGGGGDGRCEGFKVNPFAKQGSFGEFKYYSAHNGDSFDLDEPEYPSRSVSGAPPPRQPTEESEEDQGEEDPLIRAEDTPPPSVACGRPSPNGQMASPLSPLPPCLPSWKSPAVSPPSVTSWRAPATSKPATSFSFLNGRAESPATPSTTPTTGRQVSSPFAPGDMGATPTSPATPTGKPCLSSPSFCPAPSRSLLSSPILSFGRASSSPTCAPSKLPLPGTLPSPGARPATAGTPSGLEATKPASLPPPQEFGKGNPFMLFLCLSILLEHRDHIVKNSLDYNELAMHFDRLVRRHNLARVLQRAKALFADYLQSEVWDSEEGDEVSSDSPTAANTPTTGPPSPPVPSSPESTSPNSTYNLATTIPSLPTSPNLATSSFSHPASPNLATTIPSLPTSPLSPAAS